MTAETSPRTSSPARPRIAASAKKSATSYRALAVSSTPKYETRRNGTSYFSSIDLARWIIEPEHCTTFSFAPWARRMAPTRPSPVSVATTPTPIRR